MALKNQNIATANPSAIANSNYINALYQEAYGRNATSAELAKFSGKTVKDSANLILGQSNSPFATVSQTPIPSQSITPTNINSTGWTDPATGKETPVGVGTPNPVVTDSNTNSNSNSGTWNYIISQDPFLTDQFKDQNIKSQFDSLSPTLQGAYIQMLQSLGKTIEAGKVINPNIEITPEKVQEFTNQATQELDPYYQEQIRNYQKDLNTSITRLTEDFNTGVRNAEEPFKRNMAAQAETESQNGLTYGSERQTRENTALNDQQQKLDELAKTTGRSIEDAYRQTERTLGSDAIGSIATLPTYDVNKNGFSNTGSRSLYTPQGGMIGTLSKDKTTAIKNRVSDLENAYRQQRILNVNL